MADDELTLAQNALREFGYDIQEHSRRASDILIRLGLLAESASVLSDSQRLLNTLRQISGKDFLLVENTGD